MRFHSPAVRMSPVFFPLTGSEERPVSVGLREAESVKLCATAFILSMIVPVAQVV